MVAFLSRTFLYSLPLMNVARQSVLNNRLKVCAPIKIMSTTTDGFFKPMVQVQNISTTRTLQSSDLQTKADMEKAMNAIEELFGVAKDEMEYAEEAHGSVYYHEDHATAKKAVDECLDAYNSFLKDLPTDDMRQEVQGKVGMKLKELKMAFDALPMEDH
ncbi:hypothetical protein BCR42DRAFT_401507 [Absidia repens]|uniref:Uncharacterized protein n=1 Tax=Absidia repens TaxID=90262 RepID=A0A1X2J2L0_9FUNG|nr:hypothetical protein BCR42DRAFT_401507 [Absidia repens]